MTRSQINRRPLRARRPASRIALCCLIAAAFLSPAALHAVDDPARNQQPSEAPQISASEAELMKVLEENGDRPLSDVTVAELSRTLDLVSIARQERAHVERAVMLSWIFPGAGHYLSGATGTAFAFAGADLAVGVATAVAGYWLLPPSVQHRNLNYLQSSFSEIETQWETITPAEMLPTAAVVITGGLLSLTIRYLAAQDARETSIRAIGTGRVSFEPRPLGRLGR
ncbi:MAG: hypothetical protein ACOC0E_00970 [Spirochaetota bacterium]